MSERHDNWDNDNWDPALEAIQTADLKWFEFNQNNSGGYHTPPAISVLIQARSTEDANRIAEEVGLYFDGCDSGCDCSCCGDRWIEPGSWGSPTKEPSHFGKSLSEELSKPSRYGSWASDEIPDFLLVYADGRREEKRYPKKRRVK